MSLRRRTSGRGRRREGATMVEMALVLPVFLLLTLAVIEIGWMAYVRQAMNLATREGVRAMAVRDLSNEDAEAYARNYLNSLPRYDFEFTVTNVGNSDTVGMAIRLPANQVSLAGLKMFSLGDLNATSEMVRETSY